MKSYRFTQAGNLDSLTLCDEPIPKPQRGEVLVRVRATSLNYRDLALVLGKYSSAQRTDLIPLSDAAGEVVELGEDVDAFRPGDRVINTFHARWYGGPAPTGLGNEGYGSHRDGWLTEYKVVHQDALIAAPARLSFEEAATLPCAGLTAWTSLLGIHPIHPGATVLTLGSGGVSVFAVQLAKHLLGARVIATTSSIAKAERLKRLGADDVINYREVEHWGDAVRTLTDKRGVDRVIEVGGAGTLPQSLRAVAAQGEIAIIGFLDEAAPGIAFNALFQSRAILHRISVGDRAGLQSLVRAIDASTIKPVIDSVFPFMDARQAWRHFESRAFFGKVVITH